MTFDDFDLSATALIRAGLEMRQPSSAQKVLSVLAEHTTSIPRTVTTTSGERVALITQATWPTESPELAGILEQAGWEISDGLPTGDWRAVHPVTHEQLVCVEGDVSQQWIGAAETPEAGLMARFGMLDVEGLDGERELVEVVDTGKVADAALVVSDRPWGENASREEREAALERLGVSVVAWAGPNLAQVTR